MHEHKLTHQASEHTLIMKQTTRRRKGGGEREKEQKGEAETLRVKRNVLFAWPQLQPEALLPHM